MIILDSVIRAVEYEKIMGDEIVIFFNVLCTQLYLPPAQGDGSNTMSILLSILAMPGRPPWTAAQQTFRQHRTSKQFQESWMNQDPGTPHACNHELLYSIHPIPVYLVFWIVREIDAGHAETM